MSAAAWASITTCLRTSLFPTSRHSSRSCTTTSPSATAKCISSSACSIVAECGELITTVLFNKTTATGRKLVIVDASMTELIRPALYGSYHNIENITSEDEVREKYTIVGTACESTDVFDENVTLRKTRRGDLLTLKSAGAYGMSMASRYNLHDLPGAVYSDEIR